MPKLGYRTPAHAPFAVATTYDIYWAAGIFEGEGSLVAPHGSLMTHVTQKDRWILDKLRALFGGTIAPDGAVFKWYLSGARARGFIQTIYILLSPRRQVQARRFFDWLPADMECTSDHVSR